MKEEAGLTDGEQMWVTVFISSPPRSLTSSLTLEWFPLSDDSRVKLKCEFNLWFLVDVPIQNES